MEFNMQRFGESCTPGEGTEDPHPFPYTLPHTSLHLDVHLYPLSYLFITTLVNVSVSLSSVSCSSKLTESKGRGHEIL